MMKEHDAMERDMSDIQPSEADMELMAKSGSMNIKRPQILLEGIQIKSEECFHRLCTALTEIEEQCGIMETDIVLKDIFFCPWIRMRKCKRTPMERLVIGIVKQMKTKGRE